MRWFPTLVVLAVAALTGCAESGKPVTTPAPAKSDPGIMVTVAGNDASAREMMHQLAVECWLDGIVGGAQLFIKRDGNLVIVGETDDLVAANFIGLKGDNSRWRLTGKSVEDPEIAHQLLQSIERANQTGETSCPRATG